MLLLAFRRHRSTPSKTTQRLILDIRFRGPYGFRQQVSGIRCLDSRTEHVFDGGCRPYWFVHVFPKQSHFEKVDSWLVITESATSALDWTDEEQPRGTLRIFPGRGARASTVLAVSLNIWIKWKETCTSLARTESVAAHFFSFQTSSQSNWESHLVSKLPA